MESRGFRSDLEPHIRGGLATGKFDITMDEPAQRADLPAILATDVDVDSPLLSPSQVQGMSSFRRASDSALHQGLRPPSSMQQHRLTLPPMRLQLSIPARRNIYLTDKGTADIDTACSESTADSPVVNTPSSIASPISGVVDLSAHVTTTSSHPVAHGGLSDIYMGQWAQGPGVDKVDEDVTVAIKLLRVFPSKDQDQDGAQARKKLNREVYVWHRLKHPNVVELFGTSYHMGGRPAMIMKWYRHGSAADYLSHEGMGADRLSLILDVARGLEYLHTLPKPIVHADLKGNNVLITDEGHAALCDFGLSQVIEDLGRPAGLTLSSPSMGPLRWQAPELANEDESPRLTSDVWSFACTAFELLTSQHPYPQCKRDMQVMQSMQNKVRPSGSSLETVLDIHAGVGALLDDCWAFDPLERPNMSQVRERLEAMCQSY